MIAVRASAAFAIAAALSLAACSSTRQRPDMTPAAPPPPAVEQPVPAPAPADGDAIPRYEPRSRYGNPASYAVFGKRYYVLSSSSDYLERGVASWYGPGFHQVKTSMGEMYDMYAMTAAHRTLPLPAYVRVTNLQNGLSVVVRVNDRGPFVGNRLIDLSYTAAKKLDMLKNGTALVEVRALDPVPAPGGMLTAAQTPPPARAPASMGAAGAATPATATPATAAPATVAPATVATAGVTTAAATPAVAPVSALYLQAGAFADPANAERLAATLRGKDYGKVFVRDDVIAGRRMYRVRIGPVPGVAEFDRIVAALEKAGVRDAHLALN